MNEVNIHRHNVLVGLAAAAPIPLQPVLLPPLSINSPLQKDNNMDSITFMKNHLSL
jgi:hypothetical protein